MSKNSKIEKTSAEEQKDIKTSAVTEAAAEKPEEKTEAAEKAEEISAASSASVQADDTTDAETDDELLDDDMLESYGAPATVKSGINKRKLKHGALSVVLTIVFIAAVVLVNVIVGIISDRVDTAADLTTGSLFSLDDKTKTYLGESLDMDVSVTVLNPEQSFEDQDSSYKQVNEILKRMEMASTHISLKYLDIDQNPNYTAKFKGETLQKNYIVVECGNTGRYKIISPYDYFTFNQNYLQYYGQYVVEGSNIEQEAISAMMYITNDDPVRVAFTEGNSEADSSALQTLLKKNGYDVETINLTTTEIDSDIDYIVINAPNLDLDNALLSKLDKFLDNNGKFGKNVIYFASANQPATPNIDGFLRDWSLAVGNDVIAQANSSYTVNPLSMLFHLQQLCDTDYTGSVYGSNLFTFGAELRPIYVLESGGADTDVLMKTNQGSFLFPLDEALAENFDYADAVSDIFNDVVVAKKVTEDGNYSRVCAAGSYLLASNEFLTYTNSNNGEFFVGMFNYISGKEQGITIKAKSYMPVMFEMNVKTANTLTVVLCIVVPILVIVLGIVIWVRRRHR